MNEKIRYEVDPMNRLVYKTGKRSKLTGFRTVVGGEFAVKTRKKAVMLITEKKESLCLTN